MTGISRRTFAAYAVFIAVIAGLMSVVAVGGSAVMSKKSMYFTPPQVLVSK